MKEHMTYCLVKRTYRPTELAIDKLSINRLIIGLGLLRFLLHE